MENILTDKQKEECQEILNALVDYTLHKIKTRMILLNELFEVALANHIEEISK